MTSTPDHTNDAAELHELGEEIQKLKEASEESLVDPLPEGIAERLPEPTPTDAIGSVDWNDTKDNA